MALSTAEIEAVVRDLKPRLEGGRIERIDQPSRHKLILSIRNGPARYWLLICVHPRFSRLHLLTIRPDQGKPAAGFCNVVRQHMTGAPVKTIRQIRNDRIVVIESEERDRLMQPHRVSLLAELIGVGSNLLVLDESERVLGLLFREGSSRRRLSPGGQYQPLDAPAVLPPKARTDRFASIPGGDPLSLSRAIQAHYARLEAAEEVARLRAELLGAVGLALKRRRRRLRNVTAELQEAEDAETIRRKGELLKIALPHVEPGQREVVVEDLFDPARPRVTIELNPVLSPEDNIGSLFKQYKKAKASRDRLAARAGETRRQVAVLEELRACAEEAASPEELAALRRRARSSGAAFRADRLPERLAIERRKGPRLFRSVEGLEILVSRNQRQNERLTFTLAKGNDYWMHLLGWPGPHVIIRKPPGKSVSRETLLDAAHLAVHFSKVRGAEHAEVAYAQCKNVRRMKGSGPGKVSYSQATTLRLRLDPERLRRLLHPPDVETVTDEPPR